MCAMLIIIKFTYVKFFNANIFGHLVVIVIFIDLNVT
jgi:hypothetical protein